MLVILPVKNILVLGCCQWVLYKAWSSEQYWLERCKSKDAYACSFTAVNL